MEHMEQCCKRHGVDVQCIGLCMAGCSNVTHDDDRDNVCYEYINIATDFCCEKLEETTYSTGIERHI